MTAIKTAGRVVVRVTATAGGDWQVVSSPTGFQGINASKFSDLDRIPGFVRFENGEDWEEYDGDDDENFTTDLKHISAGCYSAPFRSL